MYSYVTVADLKKDLELIFQNCISFNGEDSNYGQIARQMLDMLDGVLESIVMGRRIRKRKLRYDEMDADDSERASEKSSTTKKKPPYSALEKQLRETKKQLSAAQGRIKALRNELIARDRRIRILEGRPVSPVGARQSSPELFDSDVDVGCRICGQDNDFDSMLLCDSCDDEYHYYCINLQAVPAGNWFCCESTAWAGLRPLVICPV